MKYIVGNEQGDLTYGPTDAIVLANIMAGPAERV